MGDINVSIGFFALNLTKIYFYKDFNLNVPDLKVPLEKNLIYYS